MITKMTRTMRLKLLSLSALAITILSGCLLSATFLITLFFAGPFHYNTTSNFDAVAVDLEAEEDWEENRDDIKRIESIRFSGQVTNNSGTKDVVSMLISQTLYTNYAQLMAAQQAQEAFAVITGLPIPGDASSMNMTAAQTDLYLNQDEATQKKIRDLVLFGQFFTYAIGENANFDLLFQNCVYHIAFTANK